MKRHSVDIFSLTTGLLTVGLAGILLNPNADVTTLDQFVPFAIIAVGLALLVSAMTRRDEPADDVISPNEDTSDVNASESESQKP